MESTTSTKGVLLSQLSIRNYKSCKSVSFSLTEYTGLVGCNNSGKSNIMAAIRWLVRGGSVPAKDFFDTNASVEVIGKFVGVSDDVLAGMTDQGQRTKLQPLCPDGTMRARRRSESPDLSASRCKLQLRDPRVADETADGAWSLPVGIERAVNQLMPDPICFVAMQDIPVDVA